MKKMNKKGFTIVELVIVIAVIGILAGVLIPTFSGVIANANQNAALQAARGFLTNALNMSSTASLPGKDSNNKYQTVFFVDQNDDGIVDYQFMYDGNELIAVNRSSGTWNTTWTFNSILIHSESMLTTYNSYTIGSGESHNIDTDSYTTTKPGSFAYDTTANKGWEESKDRFTLDKKTANMIYSALNYADNYKLKTDNSGLIYAGEGEEATHYNKLSTDGGIKFENNNYIPDFDYNSTANPAQTIKDSKAYSDNADSLKRFYLNQDFNRKVIVFTTFSV